MEATVQGREVTFRLKPKGWEVSILRDDICKTTLETEQGTAVWWEQCSPTGGLEVKQKLTMQDIMGHIPVCNVSDSETGLPWDFPGSLVVKIPCFKGRGGVYSTPGWGTKILHAMWCGQKIKEKKKAFPLPVWPLETFESDVQILPPRCSHLIHIQTLLRSLLKKQGLRICLHFS